MKCSEAAEYVSALCDGATIPSMAAEHISSCQTCRDLLRDYAIIGAEMRRIASLEIGAAPVKVFLTWQTGFFASLWQKGRKTIRISRLAFAALVCAVVVLGSGWVRQSVRASSNGSVLLLQLNSEHGPHSFCTISAVDKTLDKCGGEAFFKSGNFLWSVQIISKHGDRATLAVKAAVKPRGAGMDDELDNMPQQQYELSPSEPLTIPVDSLGKLTLTGQWIDHVPAVAMGPLGQNQSLDPGPTEFRFLSPVLLRDNKLVGNLEGMSTTLVRPDAVVDLFIKGAGHFDLSLSPMPGAIEGKVDFNRISFNINGQSFAFITGAPISRSKTVWVLFNSNPPAGRSPATTYLGQMEIGGLFPGTE